MSRSGYSDNCDDDGMLGLYRANVDRSIRGKRGQAFFRELAAAMDAMPEKVLITDELINEDGDVCTLGAVCKARGVDATGVDVEDAEAVGKLLGITRSLAAEIEYMNDDYGRWDESHEDRWTRMRKWVDRQIVQATPSAA